LRPNTPTPTTATGIELGDDKEILDGQLPGKIVNAKHRKSIWIANLYDCRELTQPDPGCGNL
jgi:hypothetical protein